MQKARLSVPRANTFYRNTTLGVIEAKAWDEEVTEGLGQAKD